MQRKLTITVDEEVYHGLHAVVGRGKISAFLNRLARPHVVPEEIEAGYRAMAEDQEYEAEAAEWTESVVEDIAHDEG
ncbi:MAG: addiction module antitoxin [Deltaproteobacteria bacterium]|nr:addiction module antitoxin [Deltaproteobacteria bacterium]